MSGWGKAARKILNLPEKRVPEEPPAPGGWQEAAARLQATETGSRHTSNGQPEPRQSPAMRHMAVHDEKSFGVFARIFGRGLLWTIVALAAITGIRQWLVPAQQPPAPDRVAEEEPAFPAAEAQAVAARWAHAYLHWDEDDPERRAVLLAADMAAGADAAAGWDGNGRQSVLLVVPGEVTVTGEDRARVHVTLLVEPQEPAAEPADEEEAEELPAGESGPRWMALEIPVTLAKERVVVAGSPGLVGVPDSGPQLPARPQAEHDMELSGETRDVVARFFREYAAGDITAELAPGSTLPNLPPGVAFGDVQSWSVDQGSGDARHGTAVVIWRLSGAQLTQSYRVELTRVSASSGQRWQVADIHGGRG